MRPATPGGRVAERRVMSCSASWRVRRISKGEKAPAALLSEPAWKPGWKGKLCEGQGEPPGPEEIWKAAASLTSGPPAQGVRVARRRGSRTRAG